MIRFRNFAEWNQKTKKKMNIVIDILKRIFNLYQKKNQRNEHRLNFVRAYYNAFADDLALYSGNQIAFANKAIQNFDSNNQNSMPVFEQGVFEMLGGLRANQRQEIP